MMDWDLAIAKNLEALRHILTMLVSLVEIADGRSSYGAGDARQKSLPRHLHRFVLRLLRPAESATRRLIFIAARGLEVTVPPPRIAKRKVAAEPVLVRNEFGIAIVMVPGQRLTPAGISPTASQRLSSFPLLDPFKRFGFRRRYVKPSAMPRIRLLGGDPVCPQFRRPEPPLPPPVPPPPSLDDPLDAASIHRRLGAIGRVLDDLPTQALRMARWQARRHARFEQERALPAAVLTDMSPAGSSGAGVDLPRENVLEGTVRQRGNTHAQDATQPRRRFQRFEPMRRGRPPGWRKKPDHEVFEILKELHGLAVWARDRRDSS